MERQTIESSDNLSQGKDKINANFEELFNAVENFEPSGEPGASAYEIAIANGFEGDVTAWLASLRGEDGDNGENSTIPGPQGLSAYEVAVENGFEGTEEDWLESLKGENGQDADAPDHRSGTAIQFDAPAIYGYESAETGDITLNDSELIEGLTQLLIHNDSAEPAFETEFKIISGEYVTEVDNYILLLSVKPNLILVTISQGS